MRSRVLFLLAALALLAGDSASEKAIKKELAQLAGRWQVVRVEVNGVTMPKKAFLKVSIIFKDDRITFKDGNKIYDEISFTPDPAKKPKSADLKHTSGLKKGLNEKAIYELKGDQLKLCIAPARQDPPKTFASEEGTGQELFILKRAKDAGK